MSIDKPINSEEVSEDVSFEIGPYFIPPGYEVICTDPSHNMGRFFHLDHCSGIKLKRTINSVSPASTKIPTQMDWLIGALDHGQICIDYLKSLKHPIPGVARSYADEAAFYAFRAFPELRELSPASTKEETAQEAWYRAFQYAARHGWEYELDGIPDYIALEPEASIESD